MTTKEYFEELHDELFPDVDIQKVVLMTDAKQRAFMLEQVDKLLSPRRVDAATYFVDNFWHKDADNPLRNLHKRGQMNDDEKILCAFYTDIATLLRSIITYEEFEPIDLGINADADYYVDNEPLTKFATTTKYQNIGAYIAYIMLRKATDDMTAANYQPAQDYLSDLTIADTGRLIESPDVTRAPRKDYIETIITALQDVDAHIGEGLQMKLEQDVIFLHDEIQEQFCQDYDQEILIAALDLYAYMKKEMKIDKTLYNKEVRAFKEQSAEFRKEWATKMNGFIQKMKEVRDGQLKGDWLEDGSLGKEYVLAHAEYYMKSKLEA